MLNGIMEIEKRRIRLWVLNRYVSNFMKLQNKNSVLFEASPPEIRYYRNLVDRINHVNHEGTSLRTVYDPKYKKLLLLKRHRTKIRMVYWKPKMSLLEFL